MTAVTAVFSGPGYRRATLVIALLLVLAAVTLLTIGAKSPYTHANLNPAYDERYDRTDQIFVGPAEPFTGLSRPLRAGGDAVTRGSALFVTAGCAGCHGLAGQGGAVAKAIAGADVPLVAQKVRQGTAGMPVFSNGLTDAELADIVTYLRSLPPVK